MAGVVEGMVLSRDKLARMIDSTNVKATATRKDIETLCAEAVEYGFGCVCVNSVYVNLAAGFLKGADVRVCSTIGFPFGSTLMEVKGLEAVRTVEKGAEELDMVINLVA